MALSSLARMKWLLPALGIVVAIAFMTRRHLGVGGGAGPEIAPEAAAAHIGARATVCGTVYKASHVPAIDGEPTFLNFGAAHPEQTFSVVIWGGDRHRFASPPEQLFDGERVCAAGRVREHRGTPQIVVRGPDSLALAPGRP